VNPAGTGRMAVALVVLALLAVLDWRTIEPGKMQQLVWLLLGFFALRIVLGWMRSRKMGNEAPVRDRADV
jgi:heme A synthase